MQEKIKTDNAMINREEIRKFKKICLNKYLYVRNNEKNEIKPERNGRRDKGRKNEDV